MTRSHTPRAELHTHLGAAVNPVVLWTIAHEQGIRLPAKDYWDFEDMVTMAEGKKNLSLEEMNSNYFHWTELIQSSPEALEIAAHSVIGGGYRRCNLVVQELRFNPMKRNRSGERDLDHIILSALWGVRRATLEYPQVKAGLILMMDRSFTPQQNEIIVNKAIHYAREGVVGIDVAGPNRESFSMEEHAPLFKKARDAGLGITVHTGEEPGSAEEMRFVVNEIKPQRIGHGIRAAKHKDILEALREHNIILEICPTSNIKNSMLSSVDELKETIRTIADAGVKFTINTDGPEMYRTNICKEEEFLLEHGILSKEEIEQCRAWSFEASFLKT